MSTSLLLYDTSLQRSAEAFFDRFEILVIFKGFFSTSPYDPHHLGFGGGGSIGLWQCHVMAAGGGVIFVYIVPRFCGLFILSRLSDIAILRFFYRLGTYFFSARLPTRLFLKIENPHLYHTKCAHTHQFSCENQHLPVTTDFPLAQSFVLCPSISLPPAFPCFLSQPFHFVASCYFLATQDSPDIIILYIILSND